MIDHAIVIGEHQKEEEMSRDHQKNKTWKSVLDAESSSSHATEGNALQAGPLQKHREGQSSDARSTRGSVDYDIHKVPESPLQHERAGDEAHLRSKASFEYSLNLIKRRLEERRFSQGGEGKNSFICIFRLPHRLKVINDKAQQPEIVSIGPYHRGKDHLLMFEDHKWSFLDKLLFRTRNLSSCLQMMRELEERTRACYTNIVLMSSHDFVEMMLLDGCFVIELLRHLGHSEDVIHDDDPVFTVPWLIPALIEDLLKLENQLPYFVLEALFTFSRSHGDTKHDNLAVLALKVFDLAFPMPLEIIQQTGNSLEPKHLLDLFYKSLLPSNENTNFQELEEYRPLNQSIQCVTQLRSSGIKFKPGEAASFLDIKFENRVLKIPAITINDFTCTLLINCVAWEQCQDYDGYKYFSDSLL